jgi:predicted DNA-binding transcriptional regulator AlpA
MQANSAISLPTDLAARRVLDSGSTSDYVGLSTRQIRRMYPSGDFPVPIALTGQKLGWRVSDLDAWLESRRRKVAA